MIISFIISQRLPNYRLSCFFSWTSNDQIYNLHHHLPFTLIVVLFIFDLSFGLCNDACLLFRRFLQFIKIGISMIIPNTSTVGLVEIISFLDAKMFFSLKTFVSYSLFTLCQWAKYPVWMLLSDLKTILVGLSSPLWRIAIITQFLAI